MASTDDIKKRPNFLVIVADDLGWSDVGCFGGEISTPNLDRLAASGIRMSNFHTASMCSPTRAMLMSGTDNHISGLGQMVFYGDKAAPWKNRPGYEGYLNDRVAALPELLQDAGYYTTLSGKWHLGSTPDKTPYARGFDRSFSLLPGGANHYAYEPKHPDGKPIFAHWASLYYEDQKQIESDTFPKDYYSSDYFATRLIEFLKEQREQGHEKKDSPFFAYLAFTAPHWPLQAPKEVVDKYVGKYDEGPDVLREKRLAKQVELGLLPNGVEPHPVIAGDEKQWDDMNPEEKEWSAKTMSVFAAMVDRLDWNVGRVLKHLEDTNEIDNTFILFMSDNGAEGAIIEALPMTGEVIKKSINEHYNNDLANLGSGDSFIWYGPRWAQAATAPSRMHKSYITEGGIRCPAIIHYLGLNQQQSSITGAFSTVMDILPTILDLAQVPLPGDQYRGREVVPVKGRTWVPHLTDSRNRIHDDETVTGWELFFHQAIRKGDWKAIFIPKPRGPEKWQLYDLSKDMGEIHDLAEQEPEILHELIKYWMVYVSEFGVLTRDDLEPDFVLPSLGK